MVSLMLNCVTFCVVLVPNKRASSKSLLTTLHSTDASTTADWEKCAAPICFVDSVKSGERDLRTSFGDQQNLQLHRTSGSNSAPQGLPVFLEFLQLLGKDAFGVAT